MIKNIRKMKYLIISCLMLLSLSCKNDDLVIPDRCINCITTIELNGQPWQWDPVSLTFIKPLNGKDSTFAMSILERQLEFDHYHDILSFYDMPYDTGVYKIDTSELEKPGGIRIEHSIYEVEYDVPAQFFTVIPDGSSYVHIEKLDKSTREVEFSFHLNMVSFYSDWHFITYPEFITLSNGRVKGQIIQ